MDGGYVEDQHVITAEMPRIVGPLKSVVENIKFTNARSNVNRTFPFSFGQMGFLNLAFHASTNVPVMKIPESSHTTWIS